MAGRLRMRQRGHTLAELLLVVAILAVVGGMALPALRPAEPARLDHAAERVAQALRFARDEALRDGRYHGVRVSPATQQVTVFRADMAATPVDIAAILYHPLSKQPFEFTPGDRPGDRGARIANGQDPFDYGATGRRVSLLFDPRGTPVWYVASDATTHPLVDGRVELALGVDSRVVTVAPYTGRVQVQ